MPTVSPPLGSMPRCPENAATSKPVTSLDPLIGEGCPPKINFGVPFSFPFRCKASKESRPDRSPRFGNCIVVRKGPSIAEAGRRLSLAGEVPVLLCSKRLLCLGLGIAMATYIPEVHVARVGHCKALCVKIGDHPKRCLSFWCPFKPSSKRTLKKGVYPHKHRPSPAFQSEFSLNFCVYRELLVDSAFSSSLVLFSNPW